MMMREAYTQAKYLIRETLKKMSVTRYSNRFLVERLLAQLKELGIVEWYYVDKIELDDLRRFYHYTVKLRGVKSPISNLSYSKDGRPFLTYANLLTRLSFYVYEGGKHQR